jgi:sortase A
MTKFDPDPLITPRTHRRRREFELASKILHIFEILIVITFFVLVGYGIITMQKLNNQSRTNWDLPTLTPTPLIQALILPGSGSTQATNFEPQNYQNLLPAHLLPAIKTFLINIPVSTPVPEQGIRIQIPALGIDSPIVQGDGGEQLKKGVGQHLGTANPGDVGNMVLSGHNDTFGEVFRYLDKLKAGDEIIVYSFKRSYTYIVDGWTLVNPDQVEVMDPTSYASITLISCYPYLVDNQRIIVKARLQND